MRQCNYFQFLKNFEPKDIEILLENKKVPIKYRENKDDCLEFYEDFSSKGIFTIKIIFRKKLISCEKLFYKCQNITEINCSFFDCSQVSTSKNMFSNCTGLKKIDLGNNNFELCTNFESMFHECKELEILDVSNFNTENSTTFESMFEGCLKLNNIDVSKFDSSRCTIVRNMFKNCKSLVSIDLINWDMKNIGNGKEHSIDEMFANCKKLKNIKMNLNFQDEKRLMIKELFNNNYTFPSIFQGISKSGSFTYKGRMPDFILREFTRSWEIINFNS